MTSQQYDSVILQCKKIFLLKLNDYGTAWRVLRPSSLTDQIFIKAQRIRSIQDKGIKKINEGIIPEFIGIVNYSVMALIQLQLGSNFDINMDHNEVLKLYDSYIAKAKKLMESKNHDYGEAWRDMRISSLIDIILMKIFRIKQIEDNKGETLMSEGVDSNYFDILNYAVFALIKLNKKEKN